MGTASPLRRKRYIFLQCISMEIGILCILTSDDGFQVTAKYNAR